MTHLEVELKQLKDSVLEMTSLVKNQLEKAGKAILNADTEIAEEIVHGEKRVNAIELSINRDCENILALFSPVATDLRFVLSMLNIASELERMGDYANGIAKYTIELNAPFDKALIEKIELVKLIDTSLSMFAEIHTSLEKEDSAMVRKIFKQDKIINKISDNAPAIIDAYIQKDPSKTRAALYLFSTVRRLERVGDRAKNLAEDLIFYLEAEILKHAKKKK